MVSRLPASALAREYLRSADGQSGRLTLPITLPEAPGRLGNPGTLVELAWAVQYDGTVMVTLWIDGVPAETGRLL